jgi:UDP-N-acetyl-D-glucosamine dehydrogenase
VLIATDHDAVDYGLVAEHAKLVVDSRNAMATRGLPAGKVVKA